MRVYVNEDLVTELPDEKIEIFSEKWSNIIAHRSRWLAKEIDRDALSALAREDLAGVGFDWKKLGRESLVRVERQDLRDQRVDLVPWEVIFWLARRNWSESAIPCVRTIPSTRREANSAGEPLRVVFVESCPGELQGWYGFDTEFDSVSSNLSKDKLGLSQISRVQDPSIRELSDVVKQVSPHVIHLTGVDAFEGKTHPRVLHKIDGPGFYLSDGNSARAYEPNDIAVALASANRRPDVVFFGCFNSGKHLARAAVARGDTASIGFLDTFSDALVEQFLYSFYKRWIEESRDSLSAYAWALREYQADLGALYWQSASTPLKQLKRVPSPVEDDEEGTAAFQDLRVDIEARPAINYCSLHNRRGIFRKFELRKDVPGTVSVRIKVSMDVGGASGQTPYIESFKVDRRVLDLSDRIVLPLTWDPQAIFREAVRTNIQVEVSGGENEKINRTHNTTLLPVDEWSYRPSNLPWLPSFVIPRDGAISEIVEGAQKYLPVLFDEDAAPFDGYQPVELPGTMARRRRPEESVDLQVRALWSYVSQDVRPSYINPPPTYTLSSQRLRLPAEVVSTRRGTCLDLSLLFAALLEYVEIYPVIFLLRGHAFVGYWRSSEAHTDFRRVVGISGMDSAKVPQEPVDPTTPWMLAASAYSEILERVNQGDLVPVESTALCARRGLREAISEGLVNLRNYKEFLALVDVTIARGNDIRPLPIGYLS